MHASIDLTEKLATFSDAWQPRTVALFNGHDIMVAKLRGEYHWHVHEDSDDFFLVLQGRLEIDLDGSPTVSLAPGQLYIVPRAVRHRRSPYPLDRADRNPEQRRSADRCPTPRHLNRARRYQSIASTRPRRRSRPRSIDAPAAYSRMKAGVMNKP